MLAMDEQSLDLRRIRYHDVAKTEVLTASSMEIQLFQKRTAPADKHRRFGEQCRLHLQCQADLRCVSDNVTLLGYSSSSFYWVSVANAPNVLQPYWLIVLPLDVPDLTASLLL